MIYFDKHITSTKMKTLYLYISLNARRTCLQKKIREYLYDVKFLILSHVNLLRLIMFWIFYLFNHVYVLFFLRACWNGDLMEMKSLFKTFMRICYSTFRFYVFFFLYKIKQWRMVQWNYAKIVWSIRFQWNIKH